MEISAEIYGFLEGLQMSSTHLCRKIIQPPSIQAIISRRRALKEHQLQVGSGRNVVRIGCELMTHAACFQTIEKYLKSHGMPGKMVCWKVQVDVPCYGGFVLHLKVTVMKQSLNPGGIECEPREDQKLNPIKHSNKYYVHSIHTSTKQCSIKIASKEHSNIIKANGQTLKNSTN